MHELTIICMISEKKLQIDVKQIIANKNRNLIRILPNFVINYLKRIIHQDEINEFLDHSSHLKSHDFVDAVVKFLDISAECSGFENIPNSGRFIFAANHPLGGIESMVMMQKIADKHSDFVFIVNDILMALTPLESLFIPINKHGDQSRANIDIINKCYESSKQILLFPAGLVSRKNKNEIKDLKWQKSFITKAIKTQRDIIPIFIEGQNSRFFYRLANFRKRLGIKMNLEMLFLVDEMFKQRGKIIKIKFGKVIPHTSLDNTKNNSEWAESIQNIVYSMR